ncbi:MAG: hypothetical protein FJ009_19315 [Chloroflexi bacterium]|nr:hypothetical protein [Chloroflexota bacterium]
MRSLIFKTLSDALIETIIAETGITPNGKILEIGSGTGKATPWSARYDTTQYLGLLNTYSDHLLLTPQVRQYLFDGVAQVIARYGGFIEKLYLAVLFVAQKRGA